MDDTRSDHNYDQTHDWHFVNLPNGQKYEGTEKSPNGDIIMKIDELTKALKSSNLPDKEHQEYLTYRTNSI